MKYKIILLLFSVVVLSACNRSLVSQCPTGEYQGEKLHKQKLTLEQKRLLNEADFDVKIVFKSLDNKGENTSEELPQFASIEGSPVNKPEIKNYKPVNIEKTNNTAPLLKKEKAEMLETKFGKVLKKEKKEVNNTHNTKSSNPRGMATASLVLGIISLFVAGIILGTLATIFGAISMNKLEKGDGRGMAVAGLITGIVGIIGGIIFIALYV